MLTDLGPPLLGFSFLSSPPATLKHSLVGRFHNTDLLSVSQRGRVRKCKGLWKGGVNFLVRVSSCVALQ